MGFGDRPDARRVREEHGLQGVMPHLFPNRADSEVYCNFKIDATKLVEWLEQDNARHPEYKTTIFHCVVAAVARMVNERPILNRYIQGRRLYERYEISLSFVAKRHFADGADEALLVLKPKQSDSITEISRRIYGDVTQVRQKDHATDGVDKLMDVVAKLPMPLIALICGAYKFADFWGFAPKSITDGDPNFTTVLLTNLGSIQCPAVYHHLSNLGTQSIMVAVGTLHKEEMLMEDGHKEIRDVLDIGATLDERIADGFYFARSMKLIMYIFEHPEILEKPLSEPSGFVFR